ncbi:nuclear transport factor 2 family protein [Dyadobacter sp. 3J3]|uniref:nuclear transport factor 2 family protein n=1 Tax=Dyadobacter sp. 3J3 TaxID=2606600 RepID=UPI00135AB8C8|nr:nuclear transport factor 2 family protein [Dyadobacter sp. 3J3]
MEIAIKKLVNEHFILWNEQDRSKRTLLIEALYADDVEFIDPFVAITGKDKINDFIDHLHKENPGFQFTTSNNPDQHHEVARLVWNFGPDDNKDLIKGEDVFVISKGLISKVYTFIDKMNSQG